MSKAVSKKMLINVKHPEEARVAIVHDGRLMELNIEISGKEQTKGNIYKGVVLRVEPGLQAAFVDIGRAKPGFLQMGELHPDFWQWREDIPEDQRKRRPRIQEVLRRGQELVVQVEKDERDNKGSALTSYISLPGRYMVLMPGSDSTGISRKVEQESVRKQLKEIMAGMQIPEGIGYIVRTQAVGRTPEELHKDMENLLALHDTIKRHAGEIKGSGEIYRDKGLIIRFIRDYFSDDIDEVVVDSKEACNEAKDFFRETMPDCEKRVKLHREKRPIFSRFQIEEQIDQIYEKRVSLPSGGSLVIEPTEALVSIDVNSGKTSGERGIEDTAFRTNMEAAEEVARQLRLRDLGGLIVIDFIDMRDRKHNHEVEKTLKQALKSDKARVNLGRISDFGILEMSRQRIAKTLNDAIHLECPHCEGRGKVKSVEAMALSFLRKIHGAAAKGTVAEVHGGLPLEVAYYLLNRKKRELAQIENDYDIEVTVKGKTSFLMNQLELEIVKRDKVHTEEMPKDEPAAADMPAFQQTPSAAGPEAVSETGDQRPDTGQAEAPKKRKRRRKKKKPSQETVFATQEPVNITTESLETPPDPEQPVPEEQQAPMEEAAAVPETPEAEPAPKKRKRRRSRKTAKHSDEPATGQATPENGPDESPAASVAPVVLAAFTEATTEGDAGITLSGTEDRPAAAAPLETAPAAIQSGETDMPAKPRRPRTPRSRKKPETAVPLQETPAEPASAEPVETVSGQAPKKTRRKTAVPKAPVSTEPPPEQVEEKPKPARRPRSHKKAEEK